ncbi:MAG: sugar-binding domain-containing protein [Actinomycetaceae bacterium]|nr:sugar-binding domain-containing protein [Actinomycetaceae bacterium]
MYFVEQQTMEAISKKLGVSRSTVSRLIAAAREEGLVRITLHAPEEPVNSLSARLESLFGVRVTVVPVSEPSSEIRRLERVASVAGSAISEAVVSGSMIGIAWGTTLWAISERLTPKKVEDVTIVQLNGAANPTTSGLPYAGEILGKFGQVFNAKVLPFPVPAFFDYAETRTAMWRERSIKTVRDIGRNVDVAVFGVGTFASPVASHVYAGGYLSNSEVLALRRDGVVGDICTVLIRADGTYSDIEINSRATGPSPDELKKIAKRICVVAGPAKAPPLAAALRSGAITDLIVDEECAQVVNELETRRRARM